MPDYMINPIRMGGLVKEIDGDRDPQVVFDAIVSTLGL